MAATFAKIQINRYGTHAADNFSSCSMCFIHYNNDDRQPKFLPCHHTFCIQCLRNLSGSTVLVTCPICNNVFVCGNGVDQLPTNLYAVQIAKMTNKWCLTCGIPSKLTCCYENPCHSLVSMGNASFQDAKDLQLLVEDLPLNKSSAIEQRKLLDLELKNILKSLKESEDGVRELIARNDVQLHSALSLDKEFGFLSGRDISLLSFKENMKKLTAAYKESMTSSRKLLEEYRAQKKIRIFISLKNPDDEIIPTIPLFEEGFSSNFTDKVENLNSFTENMLMALSHHIFEILKLGNVSLEAKSPKPPKPSVVPSWFCVPDTHVQLKPELLHRVKIESPATKDFPLSYSEVVNLKKANLASSITEGKLLSTPPASITHFTLRFYEKRILGEVIIKAEMPNHSKFLQEAAAFCSRPKEICRKIFKASAGIFFTLVIENPDLISAIPSIQTLHPWAKEVKSSCQWDVGIVPTMNMAGQVDGLKLLFHVEKFNKNNVESSMLLGIVTQGKELISALSKRKAQERYGLLMTLKSMS